MTVALCIATGAVIVFSAPSARAEMAAVCGANEGQAYYPYLGIVPKDKSGWAADPTTGGATRLVAKPGGGVDIVYSDAMSNDMSVSEDGGTIIPLNQTERSVSFLVAYKATGVVEVYSFFQDLDGKPYMTLVQNKVGTEAQVPKAAVYVARCSSLTLK